MRPYPVMMNLEGKQAIVVGGGRVGLRKVLGLLESGARVVVISPELVADLKNLVDSGDVHWIPEGFHERLLDSYPGAQLIFGTTSSRATNVAIYEASTKRRIPCNIADVPDLCTFIVPAVITQGDLMIAVSTGGSSPALARRIREDLEKSFGPEYASLTRLMAEIRKQVLSTGSSSDENKRLFLELVNSEILSALRDNDRKRALGILKGILPETFNLEEALRENAM